MILLASILVVLVIAVVIFRTFFDDFADFFDCLRLYFTPEIISLFRGEGNEQNWASLKIFVYAGVCVISGIGTFKFLTMHFSQ